jgi:hypothetical protein
MKHLLLIDNNWIQRINPNITSEERNILEDTSDNNNEARKILMTSIRNRSSVPASTEDVAIAQGIYDQHKIADSILIAVDIALPDGHGIINCRVNGEHKQVRF